VRVAAADVLGSPERIRAADPGGMLDRIRELPRQVHDAWEIARAAELPARYAEVRDITLAGMGGSAIGGDLAAALLLEELRVPMLVHRDYGLPGYVGRDSLVIASSYSGNTEETLSAFAEARERGAKVIALTTGGALAERASAAGHPVVRFAYRAQPRAALGYSLALVLGVLGRLGLVGALGADLDAALTELGVTQRALADEVRPDRAKRLAAALAGRTLFVYGAGAMGVMARRVKGQWNENAKNWAAFDVLPELNHNAVVGFPYPESGREAIAVLILASQADSPRHRLRWEVTRELLDKAGVPHHTLELPAASPLSELLQMILFTDHVSFYLALLNGADPTPVASIDLLKERLGRG
jgi:glucose/mannose-6-phosphate isomerase